MEGGAEKENDQATRKCSIWRKRSPMERYLILACLVLVIAFFAMMGFAIYSKYSYHEPPVCNSALCHTEAGHILIKINFSENPCEDFYNFACGSFEKYRRIPDEETGVYFDENRKILLSMKEALESDEELEEPDFVRKVKLFYRSCLNRPTRTEEIIREFLNVTKFNVWPLRTLQQGYVPTLEQRLATATLFEMQHPYFVIVPKFESRIIKVYNGVPAIPKEQGSDEYIKIMEVYKRALVYALSRVGTSWDDLNLEIKALIEFQEKLSKIPREDSFPAGNTTFSKIEEICPPLKWTQMWKMIYEFYGRSHDYNAEDAVSVESISYIKNLCKLLDESDPRIVHDYLVWRGLVTYLTYFDNEYRQLSEKGMYSSDKKKHPTSEWKYCIQNLRSNKMNPGLEYLIIKRMNDENRIKQVKIYVEEYKNVIDSTLSSQNWLDPYSKDKARTKVQSINWTIGYPENSIDEDSIIKYYESIDVTESFVENRILEGKHKYYFRLFGGRNTFDTYRIHQSYIMPLAVYFDAGVIEITLGVIISPNLVLGAPRYLNYGGIGFIISHELSHAVDNIGEDNKGNDTDWPESTISAFKEKRQCLVDQYSKFPLDNNGRKVDGFHTRRENTADNSALFLSLKAYENFLYKYGEEPRLPGLDFTNRQMFFIRYAQWYCDLLLHENDTHSPYKYRAIGPLQNSEQFSEAFNCPIGSPMNPKNKCKVWG